MKKIVRSIIAVSWAIAPMAPLKAEEAKWVNIDTMPNITFESGDTWRSNGIKYRIYGVQSCLRGTQYTDATGHKQDCGEASMAMLAAYIKDAHPQCAPMVKTSDVTYVACYVSLSGQMLDLANVMVTSGFAFASLNSQGMPYVPVYSVAEQTAREGKKGLWQFPDFPHPSAILSKLAAQQSQTPADSSK